MVDFRAGGNMSVFWVGLMSGMLLPSVGAWIAFTVMRKCATGFLLYQVI